MLSTKQNQHNAALTLANSSLDVNKVLHFSAYGAARIVPAVFLLIQTAGLSRKLDQTEFGTFVLLFSVFALTAPLVTGWLRLALARDLHVDEVGSRLYGVAVWFCAALVVLSIGVGLVLPIGGGQRVIVAGLGVSLAASGVVDTGLEVFRAAGASLRYAALAGGRAAMTTAGAVIGAAVTSQAVGALSGWAAGSLVVAPLSAALAHRAIRVREPSGSVLPVVKRAVRYGAPAAGTFFLTGVLLIGDRLVLGRYAEISQVGRYAIASDYFVGVPMIALTAINLVRFPIAAATAERAPELLTAVLVKTKLYVLVGLILANTLAALASVVAIPMLAGGSIKVPTSMAIALVAFGSILAYKSYVTDAIFYIERRVWPALVSAAAAAASNLALNFLLIPRLGISGAALSSVVSAAMGLAIAEYLLASEHHAAARLGRYWAVLGLSVIACIVTL